MNKSLVLSVVLCVVWSVNCIELENLCKNSHFQYKDVSVNAFYRKSLNRTLNRVGYYSIELLDDCESGYYKNETNSEEVARIKSEYNQMIRAVYSERYLSRKFKDFPDIEKERPDTAKLDGYPEIDKLEDLEQKSKQIQQMQNTLQRIKLLETQNERCIGRIQYVMNKGLNLTASLRPFFQNQLQQLNNDELIPNKNSLWDILERLLQLLGEELDENEVEFPFYDEVMPEIYKHHFVRKQRFVFNRYKKTNYDMRSDGTIFYDIFLPLHLKNLNESAPCVAYNKLPIFYLREIFKM